MLLHLLAAEQFWSQRQVVLSALLCPAVSAEPRPQMGQVPKNALDAYIQVWGLLVWSEVSANWIAIRVVALGYPSSVASGVVGVHAAIYVIIADCYPEVFLWTHLFFLTYLMRYAILYPKFWKFLIFLIFLRPQRLFDFVAFFICWDLLRFEFTEKEVTGNG